MDKCYQAARLNGTLAVMASIGITYETDPRLKDGKHSIIEHTTPYDPPETVKAAARRLYGFYLPLLTSLSKDGLRLHYETIRDTALEALFDLDDMEDDNE